MPLHRRYFLAFGAAGLTAFALDAAGVRTAAAAPLAGDWLKADGIEKFVTPLVVSPTMPEAAPQTYRIAARERLQQMLPPPFGPTRVWSYGAAGHDNSFASPSFTIKATRGTPTEITWINDLTDARAVSGPIPFPSIRPCTGPTRRAGATTARSSPQRRDPIRARCRSSLTSTA